MAVIKPKNPYLAENNQSGFKIRWGMLVLWVLIIGGGYYFFNYSSFFRIKDFLIEGNKKVDSEEILQVAESLKGEKQNLFKYPVGELDKKLKDKFILISNVSVTRGVPSTIKIEISERSSFLIWQSGDKLYGVDNKGYAFQEIEDSKSLLKVVDKNNNPVNVGDKVVTGDFVKFVDYINHHFEKETKLKIKEMDVYDSSFEVEIVLKNNLKIKMDTTRSAKKQMLALEEVSSVTTGKAKNYIDLRTENWVYYK